jgi:hypothetical protein
MTYYESAKGITITHDRALKELREHGMLNDYGLEGFYEECGKLEHYEAQAVLICYRFMA